MTFKGFDGHETVRVGDLLQDLIGAQDKQGQGSMMDCMQALPAQGVPVWFHGQPETDLSCLSLPGFLGHPHEYRQQAVGGQQASGCQCCGVI